MKIGLIHSPNKNFSDDQNYGLLFAPVWAYVLSSYLKKEKTDPILYDLNTTSINQIDNCDIYFFSGINQDLSSINDTCEFIKNKYPDRKCFIGGPIAWSFDKAGELDRLSLFDHICIGDGELLVPLIIKNLKNKSTLPKIINIKDRFKLQNSISMDVGLINATVGSYYGGVIEVSRGCPFLCEFCDIRVMPDNNRNHCRSINTILEELDYYRLNGVTNIQFACDNFIGDLDWAKNLVKRIIEYNSINNWNPSFYTWLTINLHSYSELMSDMRVAGFDNLFIGVESFNNNSLIETSKLQNTKVSLIEVLRKIQSYGFIVVAGLIFGFDSDDENSFDLTLSGILSSGLLSGDASLLTALPGTPLFRRMRLSGRLREFKHDSLLGGFKYVTNIKYLLKSDVLIDGYIKFSRTFMQGKYQFDRLKNYYQLILNSPNYINVNRAGYTDVNAFLKKSLLDPKLLFKHIYRLIPIIFSFRIFYLLKAIIFVVNNKLRHGVGTQYFIFWLFIWVNAINKYGSLKNKDFDITSVDDNFDYDNLIPEGYREEADEQIPENKINAQYKATTNQLRKIIELKRA